MPRTGLKMPFKNSFSGVIIKQYSQSHSHDPIQMVLSTKSVEKNPGFLLSLLPYYRILSTHHQSHRQLTQQKRLPDLILSKPFFALYGRQRLCLYKLTVRLGGANCSESKKLGILYLYRTDFALFSCRKMHWSCHYHCEVLHIILFSSKRKEYCRLAC